MITPSPDEIAMVKSFLLQVKEGVLLMTTSIQASRERLDKTSELNYTNGISLLSLKNHLLLSYLHHLVLLFSLKLNCHSLSDHQDIVLALVKLRIVLEKIGPLEGKLKYQIEKLVRKADQVLAGNDQEMINDPLSFRPNPANLVLDRQNGSDDGQEEDDEYDATRASIYRPPRVAAMPYLEAPSTKGKSKRVLPSHMITDLSTSLSSNTPYGESTTGLSITIDPSLSSGTARHLAQVEEYELDHYTRMRGSKKESAQRRRDEEEVAFGGLGAGKNGKRRLGGFGAEFDDLLGAGIGGAGGNSRNSERAQGAYDAMSQMKRPRIAGTGGVEKDESAGTSGLAGLIQGGSGKGKGKSTFDRAVVRAGSKKKSSSGSGKK